MYFFNICWMWCQLLTLAKLLHIVVVFISQVLDCAGLLIAGEVPIFTDTHSILRHRKRICALVLSLFVGCTLLVDSWKVCIPKV